MNANAKRTHEQPAQANKKQTSEVRTARELKSQFKSTASEYKTVTENTFGNSQRISTPRFSSKNRSEKYKKHALAYSSAAPSVSYKKTIGAEVSKKIFCTAKTAERASKETRERIA